MKLNLAFSFFAVVLAGCGGGGGTSPAVPSPPGATGNLTGTVAVGSPLVGTTVEVKCASGTASGATNAKGEFAVAVPSATFPCMLKASGGTVGASGKANTEVLHAIANGSGYVNITTLTQLLVATASGKSPSGVFSGFGTVQADLDNLSESKLNAAQTTMFSRFSALGINIVPGAVNVLSTAFNAVSTDPMDQLVAMVGESLQLNGRSLDTGSAEIAAGAFKISGKPVSKCRPGVKSGFVGVKEIDAKAFVPVDFSFDAGGSPGASAGGGDGSAGDGALGQFFNVTITVDKADGTVLGSAKTGATGGMVTIVTCDYTGPLRLTAVGTPGSEYFDEGLAAKVSFEGKILTAVVESATKNIGITPFTEAAYRYLINGLPSPGSAPLAMIEDPRSALVEKSTVFKKDVAVALWNDPQKIAKANAFVLDTVNRLLPKEQVLTDITRLPVVVGPTTKAGSIPNTQNGIYGTVISGLAIASKNFNPALKAPALESLQQFAADLADGSLDRFSGANPVSTASAAAYSVSILDSSIGAGAASIAKDFGVTALSTKVYVVQRAVWYASGASFASQLPSSPTVPIFPTPQPYAGIEPPVPATNFSNPFAWVDVLSDGSMAFINPKTGQTLDTTNSANNPATAGKRFVQIYGIPGSLFALTDQGEVFSIGKNSGLSDGILGLADSVDRWNFTKITTTPWGSARIGQVVSWQENAFARSSDGKLWGWGLNTNCTMGDAPSSRVPVRIFSNVSDIVSVATGETAAFVIRDDGTVWSWGSNTLTPTIAGRLGAGLTTQGCQSSLQRVGTLTKAKQVVTSSKATFALTGDGKVYAWGRNFCGLLGGSTLTLPPGSSHLPSLIPNLSGVSALHTVAATAYALKDDGTLVYWGSVPNNVLNPDDTWLDLLPLAGSCQATPKEVVFPPATNSLNPLGVLTGTKFRKLEKVGAAASAITTDGRVVLLWGSNRQGF
jgi:hypothetical protein